MYISKFGLKTLSGVPKADFRPYIIIPANIGHSIKNRIFAKNRNFGDFLNFLDFSKLIGIRPETAEI